MKLTEALSNPETVLRTLKSDPSLDRLSLIEIVLHRDGPRVTICADLFEFPADPPAKWKAQGFNRVQLSLMCLGVQEINCTGWSTMNHVEMKIERTQERHLTLTAFGKTTDIRVVFDQLIMENISAYKDGEA